MSRTMGELSRVILKKLNDGELAMNDLFDFTNLKKS